MGECVLLHNEGMKKKLPYGQSDFYQIRLENKAYVDKTHYLEVLENYSEPFLFFLRPRRFGKSLWLSVMDYYYGKDHASVFDTLFSGLAIQKKQTALSHQFYVLQFDCSGIHTMGTQAELLSSFRAKLINALTHFSQRYDLSIDIQKEGQPSEILSSFFVRVKPHLRDHKIYFLIDEYDHFTNELLSFNRTRFKDVVTGTGFVRKFYEVIKEATKDSTVSRFFATGVSPVTLDSLTSGFNISADITRDSDTNEMMGFTENEVIALVKAVDPEFPIDQIVPKMKTYYNGYLFHPHSRHRVFNSDMVLYFLSHYERTGREPENLIDANIASDYGKIAKLAQLGNSKENVQVLKAILEGQCPTVALTTLFSLEKPFTQEDFLSLMFYMGFLTIRENVLSSTVLDIPNYVIRELYWDYFIALIQESEHFSLDTSALYQGINSLALTGDITPFIQVIEKTLGILSNRDFQRFDEKYIKMLMIGYMVFGRAYYVKSEPELNQKYADIVLLKRAGVPVIYEVILEIKYLKKDEGTDAKIQEKCEEGIAQMEQYSQSDEFLGKETLKKFVLVFVGPTCARMVTC